MDNKNLDHEILKLIEAQPEITERDIASTLSVPEELVKTRIANFKDTRQKILIMGDGSSAPNIKATLEAENYNVVKVPGGFSALEVVKSEKPDLVLLDTGLADLEGFKICKQLRTSSRYWWIPVMVLSDRGGVKNRVKAFESGVDDYVTTPFNPVELRARVGMILRRAHM
ncbi:response regulator transcription factor [Methanosarcina sp.]|uniref:response regulator transcription factor n=1 Tax=Methanosarcina sp. TaxID=2213 RepID=UPI003C78910D